MKLQLSSGVSDRQLLKVSRFNQDVGGRLTDFGIFAAHHAAKCDRVRSICDDAHARIQFVNAVVKRSELFILTGVSNNDRATFDFGKVERVKRLPTTA